MQVETVPIIIIEGPCSQPLLRKSKIPGNLTFHNIKDASLVPFAISVLMKNAKDVTLTPLTTMSGQNLGK